MARSLSVSDFSTVDFISSNAISCSFSDFSILEFISLIRRSADSFALVIVISFSLSAFSILEFISLIRRSADSFALVITMSLSFSNFSSLDVIVSIRDIDFSILIFISFVFFWASLAEPIAAAISATAMALSSFAVTTALAIISLHVVSSFSCASIVIVPVLASDRSRFSTALRSTEDFLPKFLSAPAMSTASTLYPSYLKDTKSKVATNIEYKEIPFIRRDLNLIKLTDKADRIVELVAE